MNPTTSQQKIQNPLASTPNFVEWIETIELGYTTAGDENPQQQSTNVDQVCFHCGLKPASEEKKLSKCSKCCVAVYCGRDCQINDWKKGGHKNACNSYQRLSFLDNKSEDEDNNNNIFNNGNEVDDANDNTKNGGDTDTATATTIKEAIRNEIYQRIRFYACPYAVYKSSELGNGFLFLQSNSTLKELSLTIPKDWNGRLLVNPPRSILLHYLTLGEYDSEVCKDDFEMAMVRTKLQSLVENYDRQKEVVVLMRLRCGHVSVGKAILVPDYRVCMQLGKDYYSNNPAGAIQLNLDDL